MVCSDVTVVLRCHRLSVVRAKAALEDSSKSAVSCRVPRESGGQAQQENKADDSFQSSELVSWNPRKVPTGLGFVTSFFRAQGEPLQVAWGGLVTPPTLWGHTKEQEAQMRGGSAFVS